MAEPLYIGYSRYFLTKAQAAKAFGKTQCLLRVYLLRKSRY
jgi:hypothetical protein